MPKFELSGDPPIAVTLRRSGRARRYSLRVSRLNGEVTLTLPSAAPEAPALAFLSEREAWIRARLAERPKMVLATLGAEIPVEGTPLRIEQGGRTGFDPDTGRILVTRRVRHVPAAVAGILKTLARTRLTAASDRYAALLGRRYTKITLRDTRSRWGSCSSQGGLMYSWRLIMAPPNILDYVVAHEVAHLQEMNHGPRYWEALGRIHPGYEAPRQWLRDQGEDLHRYKFTD